MLIILRRSSKSALHGLIHWLSQYYAHKGITVNGVAPALIQDTAMLPGDPVELAKSLWKIRWLEIASHLADHVQKSQLGCLVSQRRLLKPYFGWLRQDT